MLFEDIGDKLKVLAKVYFWLTVISGIICAFIFSKAAGLFMVFIIVVPFAGYLTSSLIYGFGELIEQTTRNTVQLTKINKKMLDSEQKETK